MEHYMGLQKHKKKYLFIADDIIELQMFQGCQNWPWISQGVLGSIFNAVPGNPGAWAIQLYVLVLYTSYAYMYNIIHTFEGTYNIHTYYVHNYITHVPFNKE